ncbi:MAG: hypothetical protein DMG97_16335 [Acidobacteria bacterium]|jgi:sec-independent protein translocase protein TatA|nr:MAG: hypothetical protein DMG98_14860 [Acidobacteriota bacterium]PYV67330.1 MAG: hypothetical protein DMG96_39675 [Acidobacteriota bacterium]PYV71412.1 MAG: hypothetical protein DMG97_16335 [Acidobacteriota bacterium]
MELFSPTHLLLIFGIALLLFGPSKFAALGKGLGEGIRNFKSEMKKDGGEEQKKS